MFTFCESLASSIKNIRLCNFIISLCSSIPFYLQTWSCQYQKVLDFINLLASVSQVLVMPNEAPSSFVFVFIDSWKRQRVRLTAFYIKVSLMLVGILDGFFMLFHMRFLTGTVRHRKELTQQQDKHHWVVPYNHTIPRWCSGQLKYEIFYCFYFNFPTKDLIPLSIGESL